MTTLTGCAASESVASHSASPAQRSIDELDTAICRLARNLNVESYRMLVLVREFDDRFGWHKWSFPNCAEWLAWRCGLSVCGRARESAHGARAAGLPAISAAFADGRLSYSKVRALTRAAHVDDEDCCWPMRCKPPPRRSRSAAGRFVTPIRNPPSGAQSTGSAGHYRVWRSPSTGHGDDQSGAAARGGGVDPEGAGPRGRSGRGRDGRRVRGEQLASAAGGCARCDREGVSWPVSAAESTAAADHYQVVVHVDEKSLRGGAGRSDLARSRRSSASRATGA